MSLNLSDLNPETIQKLGLQTESQKQNLKVNKTRASKFTKEQVRSHAIKCLAIIAPLSQSERERVLDHALKINGV